MQVGKAKPSDSQRMGSYVDWDDPSLIPFGLARLAKNCRYIEKSVSCRYGLQRTLASGVNSSRTLGLGILNFRGTPDDNTIVQYGSDGTLWNEQTEGSGTLNALSATLVPLPVGSYAQMSQAQNRLHLAFGNLIKGTAHPAVIDESNNVDPLSYPSIGQAWEASRYYNIGTIISPTTANSHLYRATTAGIVAAGEPSWPLGDGATVVDGAITWKEFTPNAGTVAQAPPSAFFTATRVAGAGAFAAARDVYIIITISNGLGESLVSAAKSIINTVLNDRVQVVLGAMPTWYTGLAGSFLPTTWNVYEASVATAAAAPATSAYKKVSAGAFSATVNVDADAGGAAPPSVATANLGNVGNICAGNRNMVILQKNRNAYINGMTNAAVISFNVPVAGLRLWVGNIYVGPSNCVARVACLTVAGDPTAGPYRYIGKADTDPNLGVPILATVVADNTTTGAYMQFTDEYLPTGGVDVTFHFTKIEVPFVGDIYYSKTLARMVYSGDPANRSSHWISQATDLESIIQPNNLLNVATQTKSDCICAREVGGVLFSLKNDGGHIIQANLDDPRTWGVTAQWDASGPTGPRAVDVFDSQDASAPGSFMFYWHQTGGYVYQGSKPVWVSEELTNVVKRVNLAVKQLIWVCIDNANREVHIGLPLDGAELPNKVLTLNYAQGWGRSYEFSSRSGKFYSVPGRKWSLNDIQAASAIVATRTLVSIPEATIGQQQLLFASGVTTGHGDTWMMVPGYYSDLLDGSTKTAIDQQYKTAYAPEKGSGINECVGVDMQGQGFGRAGVTITGSKFNAAPKTGPPIGTYAADDWVFEDTAEQYYQCGLADAENYGFSLEVTNKNTADYFFEIHHYALWTQQRWRIRV